ncbi:cell envelope biogenesis protein TolA [Sphingomonas sp.]|uniref:cell envelope biogenesis protein TolA n=1 Tax=Sphingomonas sp. TaxID=28214 RepID=UPI0025D557FD|nr:cell envelope biogenesis protein TolA [Sphingomonas sp.]
MDRSEKTGLGLSVAGHVALAVILSLGLFAATKPIVPNTQPIDIQIVDKVGLVDTVPKPSPTPPAARVTPEVGPPEDAAPEPQLAPRLAPSPAPAPVPKPVPAPRAVAPPKPVTKPAPAKPTKPASAKPAPARLAPAKPAPAKPVPTKPATAKAAATSPAADSRPRRRPGLSRSLIAGLTDSPGVSSDRPSKNASTTPRAAAGPAVEASLAREFIRQLKPFWHSPTGADVELLRTALSVTLARDGSVVSVTVLKTTGVTDSNRSQVPIYQEAAIKAVKLAAPFSLPAEYYDTWKNLEPSFDRKLSQ